MRALYKTISQRVRRIIHEFRNRNADRDMALLDTDSEYADSQRNELVNPETLAEPFDENSDEPIWQRFAAALAAAKVEDAFGNQCTIDDFMFMGVDDRGKAAFKDSCTRDYAYLESDGTLIADGWYFHF